MQSYKGKEHKLLIHTGVFVLYIVLACIANWSLILGENLMKWDIWMAEYPNQVLVSDALNGGTVPLWNPLMQYGTPSYAMLGTPVWYPITLLLAIIGYNPVVLSFSYVIHVAIGGFGMFMLSGLELKASREKWNSTTLIVSFVCGALYSGSGLFLSNAEHIMIIISAAWIPYVFYFAKKYIYSKSFVYAMLSGTAAAMIILGGYPEMFYNTFLFLLPYMMYFQYNKLDKIISNIAHSFHKFIIICICTVSCSAISLIPFLKVMPLLTRTNGLGQIPGTYSIKSLLSLLLPGIGTFADAGEVSMINYYVGIIIVLMFPTMLKSKQRNKIFYGILVLIAGLICICSNSFVHELLYRFLPMYSSFRFPTLNRCILTMFLLLLTAGNLKEILDSADVSSVLRVNKILFIVVLAAAIFSGIIVSVVGSGAWDSSRTSNLSNSAFVTAIILGVYLFVFSGIQSGIIKGYLLKITFLGAVIFDLLSFHHVEMPMTIAAYEQLAYSYDINVREMINAEFEKCANRNKSIDFSNSIRTVDSSNSQDIVFNKTLSEDGYLSILLQNVQDYKNSYLRSIMEQNPEAYFTNNIVLSTDVNFDDWKNSGCVSPEQIYIDGEGIETSNFVELNSQIVFTMDFDIEINGKILLIDTPISTGDLKTGRLRLYFGETDAATQSLKITFVDYEANRDQYSGDYLLKGDDDKFIDIFLPDIDKTYRQIEIVLDDIIPQKAQYVCTERMQKDDYVNILQFGFNNMNMELNAPAEGYVVLLQSYYDGWRANVDGEEVDIVLVDNCFMGIKVSEGNHTITLKFCPLDYYVGLSITSLFFLILIILFIKELLLKRGSMRL